jgi:hypothetical protein
MRLSRPLIAALALRIFAEMPIGVDANAVTEALRQAAIVAGCATPRMEMVWRGKGENAIEVLLWCPDQKEAPNGETTPGSHRSTVP